VFTIREMSRLRKVALQAEALASEIDHPTELPNDFIAKTVGG
jgi:hypothetical protein